MEYNRKQTSLEPIDILKFDTVETGAVFKQYDINTSILELELVANGESVHLKDEKVYVTVKSSNSLSTQLLSKYSGASVKEKDNYKVLLRAKKSRRRDVNNIIDVYISPLALENSGEMIAEVMIIDLIKEERITSQSFTFEIKPSITPNRPSESAYKIVKDLDGTYITDAEDVQLLVAEVEPNFKLSFVGTRVNEILEKANNFDVEDNTNKIQALQEKDVELESKISNLEKKDSSLDGEIASLKSSDQSIEEEIQGLKAKDESIESEISQLKSKDTAIGGEIDKLKNADETIKSDINSKYEELKQKTDATNNEVMKLKAQDTTLGESIRTNKGLIDVINPKVATLEQDNQNVKNRVSVLEGDMNLAKSNISSLQSSNTELSQKVEGVEQGNASIDKILKQLQSDVERYKGSIELLESKVPVWKDFKGESFKVENSFYGKSKDLSIKGKTLINMNPKSIYRFNAPSSEANKYTQDKGENSVITNISEELTSWCYVDCGTINKNMFKPNTKYTIIGEFNGIESVSLMDGTATYSMTSQVAFNNNRAVVQIKPLEEINKIPNDIRIIVYCYNKKTIGTVLAKNVMILEGDWTNKSVPNYFEGIKSLGEQRDNKINILSSGKNLFNFKSIKEESYDNNSIKWIKDGLRIENHWAKSIDFKINLKPNTQYTSSYNYKLIKDAINPTDTGGGKIMLHNELTGKYFALTNPKGVGSTFTTPEDINNYKKVVLYSAGGGGSYRGVVEITNIQIEEGVKATTYESYKEYKKDILLKPLGFEDGLKGLNNSVFDEINRANGVSIRTIEKCIYDGKEEWSQYSDKEDFSCIGFYLQLSKKVDAKLDGKFICSHFKSNDVDAFPGSITIDDELIFVKGRSGELSPSYVKISILKSKLRTQDVEGFKAWLSANPITVLYELANPIITPLEDDVSFDTLDNITYVSLENNIKNELSCQCQVSLASVSKA